MQGTIAQIVALTTHGNSILQGVPNSLSVEFQTVNSTFTFCEFVRFSEPAAGLLINQEVVYAPDPHNWFEHLKKERVSALRMSYGSSAGGWNFDSKKGTDKLCCSRSRDRIATKNIVAKRTLSRAAAPASPLVAQRRVDYAATKVEPNIRLQDAHLDYDYHDSRSHDVSRSTGRP